jgi:O-antigen ligase
MIKVRLLLPALVLTFLCGYMEWGQGQSAFLVQTEYEQFFRRELSTDSMVHPFVLLPFAGQLLLLVNTLLAKPRRRLATAGIVLMGILALMILLVGTLSRNALMALSVMPFLALAIVHFRKPEWYPA